MADGTRIEWTDATWPVVQGCDYVSPGCTHCYAVPLLWRMAHHPDPKISGPLQGVVSKDARGKLHFTGKVALREDRLDWPVKWREPRRIFVPSHGDLFHEAVPDEFIERVFATMEQTPHHTYQLLTKHSARARAYLGRYTPMRANGVFPGRPGPLPNVWIGVSAEDQPRWEERVSDLRRTPAAVRFVSVEPMLGRIDTGLDLVDARISPTGTPGIDWVIVGGESGANARPMHPDWARSLRDQCQAAGVPFFFKQWGEWLAGENLGPGKNPDWPLARWQDGNLGKHPSRDAIEWRHFGTPGEFGAFTIRVGKEAAGRLLDGREWSEFPA